jgi:hypothetical protein
VQRIPAPILQLVIVLAAVLT